MSTPTEFLALQNERIHNELFEFLRIPSVSARSEHAGTAREDRVSRLRIRSIPAAPLPAAAGAAPFPRIPRSVTWLTGPAVLRSRLRR